MSLSSVAEFYEWLIRVTSLIRARKDPQPTELFDIFVREVSKVIYFDALAKFDGASYVVNWYVGPGFEELQKGSREIDKPPGKDGGLAAWVHARQESIVLGNLDEERRFPAATRLLRQVGL